LRTLAGCAALLLVAALPVSAQVVRDSSLGAPGSIPLVGGEYAITDDPVFSRYSSNGATLFHSMGGDRTQGSGFDIGVGETAVFSATHFNPSLGRPQRVITRVTSGLSSNIHGGIRSEIPDADIFLLNSSGISLGDGAFLDVQGSFYASTADVLRFESGSDFIVADTTPGPLLSTAPPSAFRFTSASPALIEVARTNELSVPAGETLSFVGGDVFVTGRSGFGVADVINAPGALLEIAAAAGTVDIPVSLAELDLGAIDSSLLGLVSISNSAKVRVSGSGETPSGGVLIRGGQFVLASGAQIHAKNDADTAAAAGPIDIAVKGDLVIEGSGTQIQSWTSGEGRAGDVLLSGDRVLLRDGASIILFNGDGGPHFGEGPDAWLSGRVIDFDTGAQILVRSISSGPASSVTLEATEKINFGGGASLISDLLSGNPGDGGVLSLDSASVSVDSDSQISTLNNGTGAGATIEITGDTLEVKDGGGIVSRTEATGAGGNIDLDVGSLAVTDAGRVTSDTSAGPGGAIDILANSVLVSNATDRAEGTFIEALNGGSLSIDASFIDLIHGGQIFTRAEGALAAGPLTIINADLVTASGVDADDRPSGLFSRTTDTSTGDGGTLSIDTRILEVEDGAEFSTSTFGAGDAGDMVLRATERMTVRGGTNGIAFVAARAKLGSTGNGGSIEITTNRLELLEGGQVSSSTFGAGNAGNIEAHARTIEISGIEPKAGNASGFFSSSGGAGSGAKVDLHATESISMSDRARIQASSTNAGDAGDILVDAGDVFLMEDSVISTEAISSEGGNVKITARDLVFLENSDINTRVALGASGGDVTIDPVFTILLGSDVNASAPRGTGGNILFVTDAYFQADSNLNASGATDGNIEVTPPDTDLLSAMGVLPTTYLDASSQLERGCAARSARAGSFVVRAREASLLPPDKAIATARPDACPLRDFAP